MNILENLKRTGEARGKLERLSREARFTFYFWLDRISELLPKLEPEDLWRPLVVAALPLYLQLAACQTSSGFGEQTSSSQTITGIYQTPSQTSERIPRITPTPTLTSTRTATQEKPTETPTLTSEGTASEEVDQAMEIEGLRTVWNVENERWEYRDPATNTVVGYWDQEANEGKGAYLHSSVYLRPEWKGLFVGWSATQIETAIDEALARGEGKLPLPGVFDAVEIKKMPEFIPIAIRGLKQGTEIPAPVGGDVIVQMGAVEQYSLLTIVSIVHKGQVFDFCLPYNSQGPQPVTIPIDVVPLGSVDAAHRTFYVVKIGSVEAGDPIIRIEDESAELPSDWIRGEGWQMVIRVRGQRQPFSNDLLKDERGLFVYPER